MDCDCREARCGAGSDITSVTPATRADHAKS